MSSAAPSLAFDEYGRPFIIMRDQERRKRLSGMAAQKVTCIAYRWHLTQVVKDSNKNAI